MPWRKNNKMALAELQEKYSQNPYNYYLFHNVSGLPPSDKDRFEIGKRMHEELSTDAQVKNERSVWLEIYRSTEIGFPEKQPEYSPGQASDPQVPETAENLMNVGCNQISPRLESRIDVTFLEPAIAEKAKKSLLEYHPISSDHSIYSKSNIVDSITSYLGVSCDKDFLLKIPRKSLEKIAKGIESIKPTNLPTELFYCLSREEKIFLLAGVSEKCESINPDEVLENIVKKYITIGKNKLEEIHSIEQEKHRLKKPLPFQV